MSDYLSDEEQVARLQTWWRSYGMLTIVGGVLALALVLGWRWYQARQAETVAAASALYDTYSQADDAGRAGVLNQLMGEFPDSTYTAFARMDAASRAVAEGKIDVAIKHYQGLTGSRLDGDLKDLANLRLARLLQEQGKSDSALSALSAVRGTGFRSQVAELKGDILFQQGDKPGAHETYAAAVAAIPVGSERPVLKMKENNTATAEDGRSGSRADDNQSVPTEAAESLDAVTETISDGATDAAATSAAAADAVDQPNQD